VGHQQVGVGGDLMMGGIIECGEPKFFVTMNIIIATFLVNIHPPFKSGLDAFTTML
jgi:hypothetical protein